MKISTQNHDHFPLNMHGKFTHIKALGFDSYEIDGKLLLESLEQVRRAIQSSGLPVTTACGGYQGHIGDYDESQRQRAIQEIGAILAALQEVGGRGLVVPAGWGLHQYATTRTAEEDFAVLSDSLRQLDAVAQTTETYIYLEPLNKKEDHLLNTLDQARRLIIENDLKRVKIIGDFYHMNLEEEDIDQALRNNIDYLGHIHLADHHRYQPGSGNLDFPLYLEVLEELGYTGDLAFECSIEGDGPDQAIRESLAYLRGQ